MATVATGCVGEPFQNNTWSLMHISLKIFLFIIKAGSKERNIQLKERTELLYKLSREYLDMKVYLGKMAQVGEVDLEQHQQNEQVSISEANDRVNPDTEGRPRSNSQGFQGFRRVNHQANSEGGSTTQFMPVNEQ